MKEITKEDIDILTDLEILSLLESVKDHFIFYKKMIKGEKVKFEWSNEIAWPIYNKLPYTIRIMELLEDKWIWSNSIDKGTWPQFHKRHQQIKRNRILNLITED